MNRPFYRLSRFVARIYFRLWHGLRVHGLDGVPDEGAVLFVANHASYFDPPLVAITNRRYVYSLGRSTLGRFAPARWILSGCATLFIDREGSPRQAVEVACTALEAGHALTIFPEGTRSATGEVGPFKRGILLILRRCPATRVVPVGVRGTWRALPRGAWFPRPARCEVAFGAPMAAAEVLADGGLDRLREQVIALATGVDTPPGAASAAHPPAESGNGGDESGPETAEYRVPRSGPEGVGPISSRVTGSRARPAPGLRGDCIPRSRTDSVSLPRFV